MKKIISLLLSAILLISSASVLFSCGPETSPETTVQYESVSLTDDNIKDYVTVTLSYENFECKEKYDAFFRRYNYDWTAKCTVEIKSNNSTYKFDDANMNVEVITLLSSNTNLKIALDENGYYKSSFNCSGSEYTKPDTSKRTIGISVLSDVSGVARIPEQ